MYFWRSYLDPVWNHYIRGPVRVWSVDGGPDEHALAALEARDFGLLHRLIPEPVDERQPGTAAWTADCGLRTPSWVQSESVRAISVQRVIRQLGRARAEMVAGVRNRVINFLRDW